MRKNGQKWPFTDHGRLANFTLVGNLVKKFWSKIIFFKVGQKIFLVKKIIGSKNIFSQTNFWVKKFLSQKNFGVKKNLGVKTNFWAKNFFGSKKIESKKNFGSKIILGKKNFG